MAAALGNILRLARTHGALSLLRAALGAARTACLGRRLQVVASPAPAFGWQTAWRAPTRRRYEKALRDRLGIPTPDFRRRAKCAKGLDEPPPDSPVTSTVLLAGKCALEDPGVQTFLLARAVEGTLRVVHPGGSASPCLNKLTLLAGVESDAEGQALLLDLRRRGIGCDWLAGEAETAPEEIPLREACVRQATPTADASSLDYAPIALPHRLTSSRAYPPLPRPLRVLTYRWHVPHQYELFKLGAEFTLVTDLGEGSCRWWDLGQRPLPANAHFARSRDIDPRQFDLAILHFDENVLPQPGGTPPAGAEWGRTFRFLRQHLAIPQVAVCHGSPRAADRFAADVAWARAEANRLALVDLLADVPVVVNSHQVQVEWGFHRSHVIWHGFDPEEFPGRPGPPNRPARILTLPEDALAELPQNRGADLLERVARLAGAPLGRLYVPEPNLLLSGNAYACAKFARYVTELQRFDVYFNPTLHSPMPRSRAEAMLCGLATVSVDNHDVNRFIVDGVNGFHASSPDELASQLAELAADPDLAWRIGRAGRRTAMEAFHIDRYLAEWRQLIREILGSHAI